MLVGCCGVMGGGGSSSLTRLELMRYAVNCIHCCKWEKVDQIWIGMAPNQNVHFFIEGIHTVYTLK